MVCFVFIFLLFGVRLINNVYFRVCWVKYGDLKRFKMSVKMLNMMVEMIKLGNSLCFDFGICVYYILISVDY